MTPKQEIKRIAQLLHIMKGQCEPFLQECSETKLLAIDNPDRAVKKYLKLASDTLSSNSLSSDPSCGPILQDVLTALSTGSLNGSLVDSLNRLRRTYLVDVLRPAVQTFLRKGEGTSTQMQKLYDRALKLDSLFHAAVFLSRLSS